MKELSNVVQNSESQPKDLYFSKRIFSGIMFCAAYIERLNFQMLILRKVLGQREEVLFLLAAFIARVKRYEFTLFIKR